MGEFTHEALLRELDEPNMYLLWTIDEIAAFLVPFLGLLLFGHMLVGLGSGLVIFQVYRRIKRSLGGSNGIVEAYKYQLMPTNKKAGLPNSAISEYLT